MIAGIVIDYYKLPTYRKDLDDAGFKYTVHQGLTVGTLTLKVECETPEDLMELVNAANAKCSRDLQ